MTEIPRAARATPDEIAELAALGLGSAARGAAAAVFSRPLKPWYEYRRLGGDPDDPPGFMSPEHD